MLHHLLALGGEDLVFDLGLAVGLGGRVVAVDHPGQTGGLDGQVEGAAVIGELALDRRDEIALRGRSLRGPPAVA
ncbi:hypothetical protein D3C71_1977170 [compost metagenome]